MGPGSVTEPREGRAGEADEDPALAARQLVVVPREVGPIVPFSPGAGGPRDELDVLVDDVFGPSTDERPGLFDVLLSLAGAVLVAWAILTGSATWVAIVGVVAIVLGLALPARSLVRRYRGASTSRRLRSAGRRGYLLDVSSRSTADLLRAHDDLVEAAGLQGSVYSDRALEAGHLAVVEVATLLAGAAPDGPAQDEYVVKRTRAIRSLDSQLRAAHARWRDDQAAGEAAQAERRRRLAAAVTEARDELQAEDRLGSLAQLERLTTRLSREASDGET